MNRQRDLQLPGGIVEIERRARSVTDRVLMAVSQPTRSTSQQSVEEFALDRDQPAAKAARLGRHDLCQGEDHNSGFPINSNK